MFVLKKLKHPVDLGFITITKEYTKAKKGVQNDGQNVVS